MAWRAWLPDQPARPWQALLVGVILAGAATGVRQALEPQVGHELPFIAYFPALIVAATFGGIIGGVACLLLSCVAAWFLFLPGGAPPTWAIGSFCLAGGLIIMVAAALADSVRELRRSRRNLGEAQARLQTMVGELAHRNRNALTVIMSIVRQSARSVASAEDAAQIINDRLAALARAQEIVLTTAGSNVSLRTVFETSVAPFDVGRFAIAASTDVAIAADLAAPLSLLFYEMATNAVKHGALSVTGGRVRVEWIADGGMARLSWEERDGPAPAEPTRQGFGTRLLSGALAPFGGSVQRRFETEGVVCEVVVPVSGTDGGKLSAVLAPG
jgi:two-component sensor histidine kinase